jgi:chromate transporter
LGFTAPLAAITAAVVGVILNLALFFALQVLWPQGLGQPFDLVALVIGLASAVALFRYRVGALPLMAVCAALGVGLTVGPGGGLGAGLGAALDVALRPQA